MASRSLDDLRPEFRTLAREWVDDCTIQGLKILITCTLRSAEEQDALYSKGRTARGQVVTNAMGGQSPHQYGLALDFVILEHGKVDWAGDDALWDRAIALAEARGLQSLRPMESAHLQMPNWKQLSEETKV